MGNFHFLMKKLKIKKIAIKINKNRNYTYLLHIKI